MIRLASVTPGQLRRIPPWRLAAAASALLLALVTLLAPRSEAPAATPSPSLAAAVAPAALAARVPHAWLAAAPPRLAAGDRVDVIGSRASERVGAVNIVVDARVLEVYGDAVVLELAAEDVTALVAARAHAYVLILVLRPTR